MLKRILLVLIVVLIGIQFIRPRKNSGGPATSDDFIVRHTPPAEIKALLQTACYDCHSNTTRYPFYAEIQPVGWWLAKHIDDGKYALNLSEFGAYPVKKQLRKLGQMSQSLSDHEMPLPSYTWIHRDARLSEAQITTLTTWLDDLHDKLEGE